MTSTAAATTRCAVRRSLTSGRAIASAVGTFALSSACAQSLPLLTKAEVEAIAVNKNLTYIRASDGKKVVFDIRDGGKAYYNPPLTSRNITISGSYEIADDGSLCLKWQTTDRYVNVPDGCYLFKHDGDKIIVVGGRNPDKLLGDLVK
jgi:hypothetical protein